MSSYRFNLNPHLKGLPKQAGAAEHGGAQAVVDDVRRWAAEIEVDAVDAPRPVGVLLFRPLLDRLKGFRVTYDDFKRCMSIYSPCYAISSEFKRF